MIKIKMTKKHESGLLLGEINSDLWITETKMPVYKSTLLTSQAPGVEEYSGDEYIELDGDFLNRISRGFTR